MPFDPFAQFVDTMGYISSPVEGTLLSGFGDMRNKGKRIHQSGDIAAPAGTPVYAPSNLEFVAGGKGGTNLRPNDYWAWFKDPETGLEYRFAHIGKEVAGMKPGQTIKGGEQFTTVGGVIDSPHVHMMVKDASGRPIDWTKDIKKGSGFGVGSPIYDYANLERQAEVRGAKVPQATGEDPFAKFLDESQLQPEQKPGLATRAVEAAKGLVKSIYPSQEKQNIPELKDYPRQELAPQEEQKFQTWFKGLPFYREFQQKFGEPPNPDDPMYNYRGAWKAGITPSRSKVDNLYHWPDATKQGQMLKSVNHPTAWMNPFIQQYGINPDDLPKDDPRIVAFKRAWDQKYHPDSSGYGVLEGAKGLVKGIGEAIKAPYQGEGALPAAAAGMPESQYIPEISAGFEKVANIPFIPLEMGIEAISKKALRPVMDYAFPKATEEDKEMVQRGFENVALLGLAPSYLKMIGKGAQLLSQSGTKAFYKYAPDFMFKKGAGGLPVPLPADEVANKLYAMTGAERAEMARKYPQFRDVLDEMTTLVSKEREPYSPEMAAKIGGAKPGLPAPPGMGETFEMRPKPETIRRPGAAFAREAEKEAGKGKVGVYQAPEEMKQEFAKPPETTPTPTISPTEIVQPGASGEAKTQALVDTAPQTRAKKITEHEDIGPGTVVNDVNYGGFIDILKSGDMAKAKEELAKVTGNFTQSAYDHHFNPLNIMARMVEKGMPFKEAKEAVKVYEKDVFRPVQEALAEKTGEPAPAFEERPFGKPKGPLKDYVDKIYRSLTVSSKLPDTPALREHAWKTGYAQRLYDMLRPRFPGVDKETMKEAIGKMAEQEYSRRQVTTPEAKEPPAPAEWPKGSQMAEQKAKYDRLAKSEPEPITPTPEAEPQTAPPPKAPEPLSGPPSAAAGAEGAIPTKKMYSFPGVDTEDLVKLAAPGIEAGKEAKAGIQSLILPTARSAEHVNAAEVLGSKLGPMNRRGESSGKSLKKDSRAFDKMGVHDPNIPLEQNPGPKFMSDMSQGRPMEPFFQRIADKIKAGFETRLQALEKAGAGLEQIRENYFPGMWTKESIRAFNQAVEEALAQGRGLSAAEGGLGEPMHILEWSAPDRAWVKQRADQILSQGGGSDKSMLTFLSRRPFKGSESFRKPKVFDDIMTGIEFGLRPISNNPIDLVKLKYAEMDRSIMANAALREWEARGDVINVDNSGRPLKKDLQEGFVREDWAKIKDPYGEIWIREKGKLPQKVGYRVAKKPVAEVINNYLSSTLYNNPYVGRIFKIYMATGNLLNQTQLGVFSAFHAGFTTAETQISAGAGVVKDLYGVARGSRSVGDLGRTLKKYPLAWAKTAITGNKVLAEWNNPQIDMPVDVPVAQLPTTPEGRVAIVAKAAELAGGGFKMEQGLRTYQTDKVVRDWYGGKKAKAALRSPIALTELGMKPVLEVLVPRQKAGVFADLVGRIMEQNPSKTLEQLTPELRQAWNRTDARLGQVRYDRLFINNAAKNAIQGVIRAPGWTGGTIAEIGGAPKDLAKFVKEWFETGKAPKELPDRVAYTISLIGSMALLNGALTYAFTGEKPQGMDWWAFRDGTMDAYGKPNRWLVPSYAKDLMAWWENPGHTLVAKTHPLLSVIGEVYRNKDYYNRQIWSPEGTWEEFGKDVGTHIAKAYVPFWMRGAIKAAEPQGGVMATLKEEPQKIVAPLVGVMPATRAYTESAAEKKMDQYAGGKTFVTPKEDIPRLDLKRSIQRNIRIGKIDQALEMIDKGIQDGTISEKMSDRWIKEARKDPLVNRFKRLNLRQAINVYELATPEERARLWETLTSKYDRADKTARTPVREKMMQFIESEATGAQ